MFLIFYLGRRDVISFGDRGLNRAAEWLYASENSSGSSPLHRKHLNWKPYNTLVSLYLWEAINVGLVQVRMQATPCLCFFIISERGGWPTFRCSLGQIFYILRTYSISLCFNKELMIHYLKIMTRRWNPLCIK